MSLRLLRIDYSYDLKFNLSKAYNLPEGKLMALLWSVASFRMDCFTATLNTYQSDYDNIPI